ncbi:MAG TPA: hypothetical protein VK864_18305, partial [Longimicrobiales bacterium]|nr:hypothetical protein [Longimicrobiales bacterium]
FHPDALTFGMPVHLSRLYAAVSGVTGVAALEITKFQRLGAAATSGLDSGVLTFGPDEIPTLDNDRNRPERGVLRLTTAGTA